MDLIWKVFGKENDVSLLFFSYNFKGVCENCKGFGFIIMDLVFMDLISIFCEVCYGKWF